MLPRASRATLAASSVGNPLRAASHAAIRSSAMAGTSTTCIRDRMVGNSRSGDSETIRKRVFSHGSSMIFSSLFAACVFIRSGSQIMTALYSDSNALNDSLRMISSASNVLIFPCLLSISMAEYHIGSLKYPPVFSNSRLHCDRKASLSGFSPDDFPFGVLTGKTKWTSGWANCAIWRQDGHCPQESPSRRSVQFRYWA